MTEKFGRSNSPSGAVRDYIIVSTAGGFILMRIPRFFLYGQDLQAAKEALRDFSSGTHLHIAERDLIHRIVKVLRLRRGDSVVFLDDNRNELTGTLTENGAKLLSFEMQGRTTSGGELQVPVVIAQSLIKGERFDWALEKLTELGATCIVPLITEHTVASTEEMEKSRLQKKLERWQAIVREAAEQSERGTIPQVVIPQRFSEYIQAPTDSTDRHVRLICAERSGAPPIKQYLSRHDLQMVSAVVGPEGGFTEQELAQADAHGWKPISLGSRILRSETAGMSVMAQVASLLD